MFPYTDKYTESESDIQNNNLLYKALPNVEIYLKSSTNLEKNKNPYFSKKRFQNDQRFMAICMARLWRA